MTICHIRKFPYSPLTMPAVRWARGCSPGLHRSSAHPLLRAPQCVCIQAGTFVVAARLVNSANPARNHRIPGRSHSWHAPTLFPRHSIPLRFAMMWTLAANEVHHLLERERLLYLRSLFDSRKTVHLGRSCENMVVGRSSEESQGMALIDREALSTSAKLHRLTQLGLNVLQQAY